MTSKSARVVVNILNNTKGVIPTFISCIVPNTKTGVKISDPEERFSETLKSLKHWKKNNVTGWIVELSNFKDTNKIFVQLKEFCIANNFGLILISLTNEEIEAVSKKGTGLSEIFALKHFFKEVEVNRVLKISTRYSPLNPKSFVNYLNDRWDLNYDLIGFCSYFFMKSNTMFIGFRKKWFLENFDCLIGYIDDSNNRYMEHAFFNFGFSNILVKKMRLKLFPFLKYPIRSGSSGQKFSFIKKNMIRLLYGFL